jgi:hypothetical protein
LNKLRFGELLKLYKILKIKIITSTTKISFISLILLRLYLLRTKNISIFVILSLIILFGITINLKKAISQPNPVTATADNVDDPQNDFVIFDSFEQTCESTSLHPELDIDTMVRTGQQIVVTFHEYLTLVTDYSHVLAIDNGTDTFWVAYWGYAYGVTLTWVAVGTWDGSGWGMGTPVEIGLLSADLKTLTVNIPSEAISLTGSMEWVFTYNFTDSTTNIVYMDITPNEKFADMCPNYDPGNGNGGEDGDGGPLDSIPGYKLSISMSISILTIGIIYIYTKKNRIK